MVRILFFIESLGGGGAEKVLCNLVNEMDQSKFDITVQTLWKTDAGSLLRPGIHYRYCYASDSKAARSVYRFEAAAGLLYPLHIKADYDIEAAFLECASTKIIASGRRRHAKRLAWVHCDLTKKMEEMFDPEGFVRKSERWYRSYDRVVCVSRNVKDSFDRLFAVPEKSTVLYNTIDDDEIRRKAALPLPDMPRKRRLTAVTLGRLTHQKAYDRLLRVHRDLLRSGIEYDLWILGEGEQRGELEAFIAENGLSDSVRLFGYRENPYPFVKAADLLVCSSHYEGFSTFVTEGLILGKAVVTTDCTGMRELLGDSEYGLIVDNSEDALYLGMRRMLTDDSLRAQYEALAVRRGLDFSARALTAAAEELFLSLLTRF